MFGEVENEGQKTINTRWVIIEKVKERRVVCKARLVARGFEEFGKNMETDAPTCTPETIKLCIAIIVQEIDRYAECISTRRRDRKGSAFGTMLCYHLKEKYHK